MKGKVKFFNNKKRFGFIIESETSKEYFVHASGMIDQVQEGDEVTFELKDGEKGVSAVDVKRA